MNLGTQLNSVYSLLQLWISAHSCRRSSDMHHRKHMSCGRYPASPFVRWLNLQKTYRKAATHYCCVTSPWTQRENCSSVVGHVCFGHCLAMDLHVTCHNSMQKLVIILCQIIYRSLLSTVSTNIALCAGII
jgi:hypothetical protein